LIGTCGQTCGSLECPAWKLRFDPVKLPLQRSHKISLKTHNFGTFRGVAVFLRTHGLKILWLLSILLIPGIIGIGIAGINSGTSDVNSAKVYVDLAPWGKVAPPKESDTIPKSLAELIERKKQAESNGKKYDLPSPWIMTPTPSDSKTAKVLVQQKKTYTTASPWTVVETKKTQTKKKILSKRQKVLASASPWAVPEPQKITYVVNRPPSPNKVFTSTSPWAKAAPVHEIKTGATKHSAVTPPHPSRIVACELRLVRVSDGRVISQVSSLDSYANIKLLAEVMVGRLEQESSGGPIIMMTLCNRRGTRQGGLVGREMTESVATALKSASRFKFMRTLNLREILTTEYKLESAKDITAPRFKILLNGARYVVIGGVAMNQISPKTIGSATTTKDDDLH
jgi:hypothetical protein